jgi:hypothetical protein
MLVKALFYRPGRRHNWGLLGLTDLIPAEDATEFCQELRHQAEEDLRSDDRNEEDYEIALIAGLDEEDAYSLNGARSLPGWKTHSATEHYVEWSV